MIKRYYYESYPSSKNERTIDLYKDRPYIKYGKRYIYKGKLRYKTDEGPFSNEEKALRIWAKSNHPDEDVVFRQRGSDSITFRGGGS